MQFVTANGPGRPWPFPVTGDRDGVEETDSAAGDQSPAITSTRTVDIVVML